MFELKLFHLHQQALERKQRKAEIRRLYGACSSAKGTADRPQSAKAGLMPGGHATHVEIKPSALTLKAQEEASNAKRRATHAERKAAAQERLRRIAERELSRLRRSIMDAG